MFNTFNSVIAKRTGLRPCLYNDIYKILMSDPNMARSKSVMTSSLLFNKLSISHFSTSGLISLIFSPLADQIPFHLVIIVFLIHGIQSLKCSKMNSGSHTVASSAAISALSLPLIPTCPGTQQNETVFPFNLNS